MQHQQLPEVLAELAQSQQAVEDELRDDDEGILHHSWFLRPENST